MAERVGAGVPGAAGPRRFWSTLKRDYIWRRLRGADDTRQWTSDKGVGNMLGEAGQPRSVNGATTNRSGCNFSLAAVEREESAFLFHPKNAVVTGAFSYTGRYVARRLLEQGVSVRTLTRSTGRESPFGGMVKPFPLDFSDPDGLRLSMEGVGILCNTYWVRFGRGGTTFDQAVENSKVLFDDAANAGVERVVHFSVASASSESRLPYFRGKGQVEEELANSGLSYAVIRPTLVFGEGDQLLNNMAWARGAFRSSPSSGGPITEFSRFTRRTWQPSWWRRVRGATASWPTRPGRRPSPSRNCCGCWPRRWAPGSRWCIRRHHWGSPLPGWLDCSCGTRC